MNFFMSFLDSEMLKLAKKGGSDFEKGKAAIIISIVMTFLMAFFIMIALSFFGFNVGFLWVIMVTVFSCLITAVESKAARKWCNFRKISWEKEDCEEAGEAADKGERV